MSIGLNPFGLPFMQQPNNILPPQPQPMVQNMVQMPPQQNTTASVSINSGRWLVVKSYQDAIRVTASVDGTPTICMLEDESVFYVVRNVDGRKEINGFQYTPITIGTNNTAQQPQQMVNSQSQQVSQVQNNELENRLVQMEKSIADLVKYVTYIKSALGEGVSSNDSVPAKG